MMIPLPWVFFGGLAVMLGGLALLNRAGNRKRREAYAEFCSGSGTVSCRPSTNSTNGSSKAITYDAGS